MKTKQIIISIAVILAVAVSAFTVGRITASQGAAGTSKDPIVITAAKLIADYAASPTTADKRYAGKTLIVTGDVSNVSDHNFHSYTMTDYDTYVSSGYRAPNISCNYSYTQREIMVQNVEEGDTITVKGICGGYEMLEYFNFIQLFNCELVD